MNNIISLIRKRLHQRRRRINTARCRVETMQLLCESNPTCRIKSIALKDVLIGEYVAILDGVILDKVDISDYSYISNNSIIKNVDLGKFCSVSSNVQIGLGRHPSKTFVSTYPAFYSDENPGCPATFRESKSFDDSIPKSFIANDVWIGANVIIPGGIQIGTGAILAAGAVVVNNVPPYAVVGGNPAKIIKYRFSEQQIKALLASEWWSWSIEDIHKRIDAFSDIEAFLQT